MTFYSFALFDPEDDRPLPRKLLGEGGNAIKSSSRIPAECIRPTVLSIFETLYPALRINNDAVALLGSTAKKKPGEDAGDIDIGIDINTIIRKNHLKDRYDALHLVEDYTKRFTESKSMRALNVYSFAYPIITESGSKTGQYVQVDLMPVSSIQYARWTYFAPTDAESKYKGLYRNEVLFAILKNVDYNVMAKDLSGGPTLWVRYTLDLSRGLFRNKQKKTSAGGNRTVEKEFVSDDPKKVTEIMFGSSVQPSDVLTFEQTVDALLSPNFVHKDKLQQILDDLAKGIKSKRVQYPEYLRAKLESLGISQNNT